MQLVDYIVEVYPQIVNSLCLCLILRRCFDMTDLKGLFQLREHFPFLSLV